MADEAVRVDGLKELLSELRGVDAKFGKELQGASKAAADEVAALTRASFSSRAGVAPKVAASVKAYAQAKGAQIQIGGTEYAFAHGSEFGAGKFKQFPAWRGSGPGSGYSLYPSIRANRERTEQLYLTAIDNVTKRAFPGR